MPLRLRHTINAVYVVVATNVNFESSVRHGVAFLHAAQIAQAGRHLAAKWRAMLGFSTADRGSECEFS
jgi:hypothetical protein